MRRNEVFWGGMLVVLGLLFFLKTAGYIAGDIFSWFWPVLVMAAGGWILLGGFEGRGRLGSTSTFSIPVQGAREATLTVNHGIGRLELGMGEAGEDFLTGNSGAGLTHSSRLVGDRLEVSIDAGPSVFPFLGPDSGSWGLSLNPSVPTQVKLNAGASDLDLDLRNTQVTRFDYEGGASRLKLTLPAAVDRFISRIETGASSIELRVPDGVAARFSLSGPGSSTIDQARFPSIGHGVFQSPDFESAPRRAMVTIEGGATSIRVD
jgi:hypothetical protein